MEDKEIIKALECCISEDRICEECLYEGESYGNLYCDDKLMVDVFDLIKRQQEEIEELEIITGLQRKRKYYNKFVKEVWQKERGNLSYPDFDEIYKRYFEQKERFDRIVERLKEASFVDDGFLLLELDEAIEIVKAGDNDE